MTLSIIIPTYNEELYIEKLVSYLKKNAPTTEIIVCDGGSQDETLQRAKKAGAITVVSRQKGRAIQMNYGASVAKSDIYILFMLISFPLRAFWLIY